MSKYGIVIDEEGKNKSQISIWMLQGIAIIPVFFLFKFNAPDWALIGGTALSVIYVAMMEIAKKLMFGEMDDKFYTNHYITRKLYEGVIRGFSNRGFDMSWYIEEMKKDMEANNKK